MINENDSNKMFDALMIDGRMLPSITALLLSLFCIDYGDVSNMHVKLGRGAAT